MTQLCISMVHIFLLVAGTDPRTPTGIEINLRHLEKVVVVTWPETILV